MEQVVDPMVLDDDVVAGLRLDSPSAPNRFGNIARIKQILSTPDAKSGKHH